MRSNVLVALSVAQGAPARVARGLTQLQLADLLATSATALAGLMAEPGSIPERRTAEVTLSADAPDRLLVDWLDELLFLKDRDRAIYPRAEVRVSEQAPFTLTATLHGDVVDPERTRRGMDVKAITLYPLVVERTAEGWHGHVVVDL